MQHKKGENTSHSSKDAFQSMRVFAGPQQGKHNAHIPFPSRFWTSMILQSLPAEANWTLYSWHPSCRRSLWRWLAVSLQFSCECMGAEGQGTRHPFAGESRFWTRINNFPGSLGGVWSWNLLLKVQLSWSFNNDTSHLLINSYLPKLIENEFWFSYS